jgi:hypothetical protein
MGKFIGELQLIKEGMLTANEDESYKDNEIVNLLLRLKNNA